MTTSAASESTRPGPDFSGKTALVTGAASGIGRACAIRFAELGASVLAVDIDADGLQQLSDDHQPATGSGRLVATPCDLSDLAAVDTLPSDVDILVNNAGLQVVSKLEEFPVEKFSLILTIMLEAPFRLIRSVLPHMYSQGWGRVINISSVHGLRASPFKAAYISAKHGLEGLSKVTALEGAEHGVTSNCINPAYVRTPLVEKQIQAQAATHGISEDEVVNKIMLTPVAVKRLVEPEEVADLAAFLSGPGTASITGSSFTIDGGWTAH